MKLQMDQNYKVEQDMLNQLEESLGRASAKKSLHENNPFFKKDSGKNYNVGLSLQGLQRRLKKMVYTDADFEASIANMKSRNLLIKKFLQVVENVDLKEIKLYFERPNDPDSEYFEDLVIFDIGPMLSDNRKIEMTIDSARFSHPTRPWTYGLFLDSSDRLMIYWTHTSSGESGAIPISKFMG